MNSSVSSRLIFCRTIFCRIIFLGALFFVSNSYAQGGPTKFVPNVPTAAPGQTPLPGAPTANTGVPQPVVPPMPQQTAPVNPPTAQNPAAAQPQTGDQPAGTVPPVGATAAVPPAPINPMMTDPLLEGFFEDLQYVPADKRDPFLPYFAVQKQKLSQDQATPLEPLQQFALNDLKVIGIIWDVGHPKALIIDPGGKSHIIVENTKLGKEFGYVAAIREGEIIVVEPIQDVDGKKGYQTKILKLTKQ